MRHCGGLDSLLLLCFLPDSPILFIGPTGTGKSVYVQQKLMNGLPQDKYIPTFVNFSAQTSANQTQVGGSTSPHDFFLCSIKIGGSCFC